MTATTATATKPAAPKPSAPKPKAPEAQAPAPAATPASFDTVPETDAPAPASAASTSKVGQNSQYAPLEVREALGVKLYALRAKGWTRPAITAITGYNDSTVWRGFNAKAHTTEMDTWVEFLKGVDAGTHKPPTSGRKPKPAELEAKIAAVQAKVDAALAKIAELPEKANVAALRTAIADVKAALEPQDA